ncbi:MAG: NlpC/P60 family protein [Bacteroidota bacterium]
MAKRLMCRVSVLPMRKLPSDPSEIVSQLLFGETATLIEQNEQWVHIQSSFDGYEGWIDHKQVVTISESAFQQLQQVEEFTQELIQSLQTPWGTIPVLKGSPLISKDHHFIVDEMSFSWLQPISNRSISLAAFAQSYSNTPYLWGGRSPFGIDCSGFTQLVYRYFGQRLKRDASQQFQQGQPVEYTDIQPGDAVFFSNPETGNVHHVGIALEGSRIIHAHGHVRTDQLTNQGIINGDRQEYSHYYCGARRYLDGHNNKEL